MTAVPPGDPVTGGVGSLEVRWIFPGRLEAAVARWFGRFPAETESRQDTYLLDPGMHGLSVKIRAGGALQVKVYGGSQGILDVPGRARGHLQAWQKWSFPFRPARRAGDDPAGWQTVGKRRRISRFTLASRQNEARIPRPAGNSVCTVELTEVHTRAAAWWSLGFEATGPPGLLRSALDHAAALVFAQALPGGAALSADDSRSYAEWLRPRPDADRGVGA